MPRKPDEARITAYALGELSGADAREVEDWVKSDPKAAKEVEEIRAVARALTAELYAEGLTNAMALQNKKPRKKWEMAFLFIVILLIAWMANPFVTQVCARLKKGPDAVHHATMQSDD